MFNVVVVEKPGLLRHPFLLETDLHSPDDLPDNKVRQLIT